MQATRARLRDADKAWQRGDLAKLLPDLNAATAQALRNSGPGADALMAGVADFEIALERFDRAADLAKRIDDPLLRSVLTARVAYWRGDLSTARSAFRQHLTLRKSSLKEETGGRELQLPISAGTLFLMARCGMTAEVEKLIPHHLQHRLAALYRAIGRISQAEEVEARVRRITVPSSSQLSEPRGELIEVWEPGED